MADGGGSKGTGGGGGSSSSPVPVPSRSNADEEGSSLAPSTVPAARSRSTTALLPPAFDGMSDASPHHSPLRPPAAMEERGIDADSPVPRGISPPLSMLHPLRTPTATTTKGDNDRNPAAAAAALSSATSADPPAPGSSVPKGDGVAAKAAQAAAGGGVKRVKSVRKRGESRNFFIPLLPRPRAHLFPFFFHLKKKKKKKKKKQEPRLGGDQSGLPVIRIGVCAMDKKARSKPMQEIVARLQASGEFEVRPFGDDVILDKPVEEWPRCDCLLSWHSDGFPLQKAQAYASLRRPYLINDVHMQDLLLDRRAVYSKLQASGIPVPKHIVVDREGLPRPPPGMVSQHSTGAATISPAASSTLAAVGTGEEGGGGGGGEEADSASSSSALAGAAAAAAAAGRKGGDGKSRGGSGKGEKSTEGDGGGEAEPETDASDSSSSAVAPISRLPDFSPFDPPGFVETEDFVELRGVRINKPFVEKPSNAEDHNIYIYYPHSMGGGVKRLFRKVHDKSGDYDPHHPGHVRRDGEFFSCWFLASGGPGRKKKEKLTLFFLFLFPPLPEWKSKRTRKKKSPQGSYIVEEFLTTGGTDVKVYTVGPRYAHAEARKSPVVDGKVTRSADGKELRFPVLLSPQEKEVARQVSLAFGQKVCGFDLLRSERGVSFFYAIGSSFRFFEGKTRSRERERFLGGRKKT